ncbi:MAG: hypothetical protein ACI4YB_02030 [Oscillospiraceae bacterium]
MKYGNVAKSEGGGQDLYSPEIMAKVNKFTRRELTADEVYIFPVVMCDNELDRDNEHFTVEALNQLAEKFIGKTVICDHSAKNANQTARIFSTEVVHTPSVKTFDGQDLYQLTGKAYMLKNESTQPIIDNIEAGIYKEVSVNCAVASQKCNICGQEYYGGDCIHFRGRMYDSKKCVLALSDVTDAYELSFVAVPAQPGAGVTKWYTGNDALKEKGMNKNMNEYAKVKPMLAELGVDLDGIAKSEGKTENELPSLEAILTAVKKNLSSKNEEAFLTADAVKSAAGKDMTSDEVIELIKSANESAEKAKLYDEIKSKAIDNAIKSGVKAKGEAFADERYRKIFASFSVDEVNAQADEWENEAKSLIPTGRKSEDSRADNDFEKSYIKPNLNF